MVQILALQSDNTQGVRGLTQAEAEKRLQEYGPNQISRPSRISFLEIAKEEITEPIILLLLAIGVLYSIWGSIRDALTIFGIITILILEEIWTEYRAKKSIAALSEMWAPKTRVLRDSQMTEVKTEEVVPGDVLLLASGTRVAADSRLLVSYDLQVDESSLTGESIAQEKNSNDEVYAGTLVVYGEGQAVVQTTGGNTHMGKLSEQVQQIRQPKTPLQIAMGTLAKGLIWIALLFSIAIPAIGILRGEDWHQMVLIGLALAFAATPEEIPIITTMIEGLGAYQLSKENFLIKKTRATEVLGNATVILTDKTGTITESRMSVANVYPAAKEKEVLGKASTPLTSMSLSPTDIGILQKAKELQVEGDLGEIVRERSFGNGRKTKSVLTRTKDGYQLIMLGAPEEILNSSVEDRNRVITELDKETAKGRRVIGVAVRQVSADEVRSPFSDLEKGMNFLGLISLEDSPRKGVKETIEQARLAGIRTIMVTGDHPRTAAYIARQVGIPAIKVLTGNDLDRLSDKALQEAVKEVSVFARATPEHKYRLVKALQANKEIVAVTGDGINDILALKGANIGIAMGIKGTDAAKEAADVVLADDNFVTLAHAIFQGRKLFDNLRKGFKYYLSVKSALILTFLVPAIINIPFPFAPIQIIVLELFMDLAASAAFASEPAEKTIYSRAPKDPNQPFFDARLIKEVLASCLSLFTAVFLSYAYAIWQHLPLAETQTFAFSAWIIGHIMLAYVSRAEDEPLYSLGIFTNKVMNIWGSAAIAFLAIALAVPAVNSEMKLASISLMQIGIIALISFVAVSWKEFVKAARWQSAKVQTTPSI